MTINSVRHHKHFELNPYSKFGESQLEWNFQIDDWRSSERRIL